MNFMETNKDLKILYFIYYYLEANGNQEVCIQDLIESAMENQFEITLEELKYVVDDYNRVNDCTIILCLGKNGDNIGKTNYELMLEWKICITLDNLTIEKNNLLRLIDDINFLVKFGDRNINYINEIDKTSDNDYVNDNPEDYNKAENYIDPMEIKKDELGNYYSVGERMWEDSLNKNKHDDE